MSIKTRLSNFFAPLDRESAMKAFAKSMVGEYGQFAIEKRRGSLFKYQVVAGGRFPEPSWFTYFVVARTVTYKRALLLLDRLNTHRKVLTEKASNKT